MHFLVNTVRSLVAFQFNKDADLLPLDVSWNTWSSPSFMTLLPYDVEWNTLLAFSFTSHAATGNQVEKKISLRSTISIWKATEWCFKIAWFMRKVNDLHKIVNNLNIFLERTFLANCCISDEIAGRFNKDKDPTIARQRSPQMVRRWYSNQPVLTDLPWLPSCVVFMHYSRNPTCCPLFLTKFTVNPCITGTNGALYPASSATVFCW